jgi:hypothetical protein
MALAVRTTARLARALALRAPPRAPARALASHAKKPAGDEHDRSLPDFVEAWSPQAFRVVGAGLAASSLALGYLEGPVVGAALAALTAGYVRLGLADMAQTSHALRRNFPVLAWVRYLLESVRPEIQQYLIEKEGDGVPFDRAARAVVYQRAKGAPDTLPFGTRLDVYADKYEFAAHSMWPAVADAEGSRVTIGGPDCKQPYSAALLNVSGMSYGALSENAVRALSAAAKEGRFFHNTGEGGMSRFHLEGGGDGGGDLVWNVGTGYFGCGSGGAKRVFDAAQFRDNAARPTCKMIELKLSQGAKPSHGGMLPKAKISRAIAEARGLAFPAVDDCNSPARHTAFDSPETMMDFVARLRELSGGKPVGVKLCVGRPEELAEVIKAMLKTGITADFLTIDGAEGGTGAAPPEFSNSVGMPMAEGLTLAHGLLRGAGLRDRVKLIAAGKITTGFHVVRTLAMGADVCNAARAMLFALGCIRASTRRMLHPRAATAPVLTTPDPTARPRPFINRES